MVRAGLLPAPKLLVLLAVTAGCGWALLRDPTFERRDLWRPEGVRAALPAVALRGLMAAALVTLVVLARGGDELLELPRQRPGLWVLVVLFYPLFSAWPQELLYRVFFFHRYQELLGPRGVVAASGVAFCLLHMVYEDPITLALTLPAGLVLASTYARRRSVLAVSLEHALYGLAVFTLGLGRAFFVAA